MNPANRPLQTTEPIPPRLSANPEHPWFHPFWSRWADVTLAGERVTGVVTADTVGGWAEIAKQPFDVAGGKIVTVIFRGDVRFSAREDRP